MEKIYLYLMKRDKKTIKVLKILNGPTCSPKKVSDVSVLGLNEDTLKNLSDIIEEHKMLWEVWIESAADFQELKNKLKKRGIKNVPMSAAPVEKKKEALVDKKIIKKPSMLKRKKI